jgi:uroporphyrinogen decarboxylase
MTINKHCYTLPEDKNEPDFNNLLAVLAKEVPSRATLFEFFFNDPLVDRVVPGIKSSSKISMFQKSILAFKRLGYDYATILLPGFTFQEQVIRKKLETFSLNEGSVINNREDLDSFVWPDPKEADYDILIRLAQDLDPGMKLIPYSPDGLLENVISLMGFENLCYKLIEEPAFVEDVFTEVGIRLVSYYRHVAKNDCVGACIMNDDWGYKTSTLISPKMMQHYIFPWHQQMVDASHAAGKPAILHSCGYFEAIIEDIIETMGYDARHSYEDSILPVEEAYERYHTRIAILGGIDMNYLCKASPKAVYQRSRAMLERVEQRGGYALGTGNSVPENVPDQNYFAMIRAALDKRN